MLKEFKECVLKGNVVDMAVGIVLQETRDVLKVK
jgi:large-conductance mechanosensitive channel